MEREVASKLCRAFSPEEETRTFSTALPIQIDAKRVFRSQHTPSYIRRTMVTEVCKVKTYFTSL